MKRNGFSLIETLIYIALLALLCLVAFSWVSKSAHSVSKITQTSKQLMMAQAILMRLAADVQMADAARAQWNVTDQELRLYHAKTPIIWRTDKNKLYRIENKSKALIGTEIIQFTSHTHYRRCSHSRIKVHLGICGCFLYPYDEDLQWISIVPARPC